MNKGILVLVADDNERARNYVAGILQDKGVQVIQAVDVGSAIKVLDDWRVDVAIISYDIKPSSGLEISKHVLVKNRQVGMIMLAEQTTTDILVKAGEHNIGQVMRKPVEPDRLLDAVRRVLRARGISMDAFTGGMEKSYSHDELMQRALALAVQNVKGGLGGPFAAVVADAKGYILGEGVNSVKTRSDPSAHAEVLAIRRATDVKDSLRLDDCAIYCSSEPTMLGMALIIGTGIKNVYYGFSHEDAGITRHSEADIMREMAKPVSQRTVIHTQLHKDEALALFYDWKQRSDYLD